MMIVERMTWSLVQQPWTPDGTYVFEGLPDDSERRQVTSSRGRSTRLAMAGWKLWGGDRCRFAPQQEGEIMANQDGGARPRTGDQPSAIPPAWAVRRRRSP